MLKTDIVSVVVVVLFVIVGILATILIRKVLGFGPWVAAIGGFLISFPVVFGLIWLLDKLDRKDRK